MLFRSDPSLGGKRIGAKAGFDLTLPLGELITDGAYEVLAKQVRRASYMGVHDVEGVACHHLAFVGDAADLQIALAAAGILVAFIETGVLRFCTHRDVDGRDVERHRGPPTGIQRPDGIRGGLGACTAPVRRHPFAFGQVSLNR